MRPCTVDQRTRLDHEGVGETDKKEKDRKIDERDKQYKKRITQQKRINVKKHNFALKDYVLLKHKKSNKSTTAFEPAFYTITKIQGSSITIKRIKDGIELCRNASQLKPANSLLGTDNYPIQSVEKQEEESTCHRETDDGMADSVVEEDDGMANGEVEQVRPPEEQDVENEVNIYVQHIICMHHVYHLRILAFSWC